MRKIMSFNSDTWEWFKTAPLPVVLSLCLTSFMVLGSYAWSIDQEVKEQKAVVVVAAERAGAAKDAADRIESKVDKLLEIVLKSEAEKAAAEKAEKAKTKEKK